MPDDVQQERKPWDQQEGEPNVAYARFLIYKSLGPTRTLDKARAAQGGTKRRKTDKASGQWRDDSTEWNWVERATAWDIECMSTIGLKVIIDFYASLRIIATKSLERLLSERTKPKDWKQAVDAINRLGVFIPAETVEQIQTAFARGDFTLGASKPKDSGDSL